MHQRGERLFWEGAEPGPYVFVIQQGTVRLVTGTDEAEALHDMLGPGDMIGIDRLLGHDVYRHTGCAATDVVVYALRTEDLERIVAAHRDVARYLASTTSVRETETDAEPLHRGRRSWVDDTGPTTSLASSRLLTCSVDTTSGLRRRGCVRPTATPSCATSRPSRRRAAGRPGGRLPALDDPNRRVLRGSDRRRHAGNTDRRTRDEC